MPRSPMPGYLAPEAQSPILPGFFYATNPLGQLIKTALIIFTLLSCYSTYKPGTLFNAVTASYSNRVQGTHGRWGG